MASVSLPASPHMRFAGSPVLEPVKPPTGRLMHVKILYTFDDSGSICLARCIRPININTAFLDPSTEVGIVELRICLQAIVAASPELVAKLGHDYTVYAYDFSEYETPLVGQGMLSWVLASVSKTPNAPANESRTMVTGRVLRNTRIFAVSDALETLEVKLRLVPVPTCLQSEYLASMQKYHDASNLMNSEADKAALVSLLRSNTELNDASLGINEIATTEPSDQLPKTSFLRPDAENLSLSSLERHAGAHNSYTIHKETHPASPSAQSYFQDPHQPEIVKFHDGVVSQRASDAYGSPQLENEMGTTDNDGPQRKRAKVVRSDWQGVSSFGTQSESLRVAASTAASVRGPRPLLPQLSSAGFLADTSGPRPPTPRPTSRNTNKTKASRRYSSSVVDSAITSKKSSKASSRQVINDERGPQLSNMNSPEANFLSIVSSPVDIPSSPPMLPRRSASVVGGSTAVNTAAVDSGFASGTLQEYLDDEAEHGISLASKRKDKEKSTPHQVTPIPELAITEEVPGDPSLLPRRILPRTCPHRRPSAPSVHVRTVQVSSPQLPPLQDELEIQSPALQLEPEQGFVPVNARSKRGRPKDERNEREGFKAQDFNEDSLAQLLSSATGDIIESVKPSVKPGLKRKRAIQQRLEADVAAGKMPPFCKNCGEINTPTWRKCFIKVEEGEPNEDLLNHQDENFVTWEATKWTDDGKIRSFRIIKKSVFNNDQGYEEVQLCNPCGIWLFKFKTMRPPERWSCNRPMPLAPTKKRKNGAKKCLDGSGPSSSEDQIDMCDLTPGNETDNECGTTAPLALDQFQLDGPGSGRSDRSRSKSCFVDFSAAQNATASVENGLPDRDAFAALQRAIQCSPPKFPGSVTTPNDVNTEGLDTTRRLLFPSPSQQRRVRGTHSYKSNAAIEERNDASIRENDNPFSANDKENVTRTRGTTSSIYEEKSQSGSSSPLNSEKSVEHCTPKKQPRRSMSPRDLLTSAAKRLLRSSTTPSRSVLRRAHSDGDSSPFTATLNQLMARDGMSPSNRSGRDATLFNPTALDTGGFAPFSDFGMDDLNMDFDNPLSDASFFPLYEDLVEPSDGLWDNPDLMDEELQGLIEESKSFEALENARRSGTSSGGERNGNVREDPLI